MNIYDQRNLSMLIDFYELTMSNNYYINNNDKIAIFDLFYRKNPDNGGFVIYCGLTQVIEYINNINFTKEDINYLESLKIFNQKFLDYLSNFKFTGDIYSVKEGTVIYPNTPILIVKAPIIQACLIETMLLLIINHQSLIATKTNRIVYATKNQDIYEMGARRAQGFDAAIYGSRAAYIAGTKASATLYASKAFNIPTIGTMAHSWIQYYDNEYEAFKIYAQTYYNNCILLIDTYDVLKSGIINAIKINKEILIPKNTYLKAVRIDSGDLAYLSKKVRQILDDAKMYNTKIIVSGSINEFLIHSLNSQNAKIDAFGVGENLITSTSDPILGCVYKLVAIQKDNKIYPKIKLSETPQKIVTPGYKTLYRIYNKDNISQYDIISKNNEIVNYDTTLKYEQKPWQQYKIDPQHTIVKLHHQIYNQGKQVYPNYTIDQIREYLQEQLKTITIEEKRFSNPHIHKIDLTLDIYNDKIKLLTNYEK